jgi:hypothetical protein
MKSPRIARTFFVSKYLAKGVAMQDKDKNVARIYVRRAIHEIETVQRMLPGWVSNELIEDSILIKDVRNMLLMLRKLEISLR